MLRRRLLFTCIASAILILTADWLFFDEPIGWTLSLFLTLATVLVIAKGGAYVLAKSTIAVLILLLGLLVSLAMQLGPLVLLMTLIVLAMLAMNLRQGPATDALQVVFRLFRFGLRAPFRFLKDARLVSRLRGFKSMDQLARLVTESMRKWFLPITGALVFSGLFAIANPIISSEIQVWAHALERILLHFQLDPARPIFWAIICVCAWGLLRTRTPVRTNPNVPPPLPMPLSRTSLLQRCLILFNGVFAVQTILDALYLFGGVHLPNGMTYAEYAHRGSYPLVITTLLAAGFVLIGYRPGPATRETTFVRRLVLLWILQNVFLTITSAWRLHIYTEIYGLTRLRVAASIWMLLVAAGLGWIALRIAAGQSNRWLVNRVLITTFIVLYTCCFVNFDNLIAWQNVRHCREAGGNGYFLDYSYMQQLGPEAIPALQWLGERSMTRSTQNTLQVLKTRVNLQMSNWRSWTYRGWILWDGIPE